MAETGIRYNTVCSDMLRVESGKRAEYRGPALQLPQPRHHRSTFEVFSHIYTAVADFDRALAFYEAVLGELGIRQRFIDRSRPWAGWQSSPEPRPLFLIGTPYDGNPHRPGNGQMVAFLAPDRARVDAAWRVALAHGGTDEGAPGLRPEYHADYHGAYFRDPEGNKICVACHAPAHREPPQREPVVPAFPLLETPRLRLREIVAADAPALFAIHGDAHRMRWFGNDPLPDLAAAEKLVGMFAGWRRMPNPGTRWAIEAKDSPGLIGTCGLFAWNRDWKKCITGYELAQEAEGQGYMREALEAIIAWGWSDMQLNRIEALVHPYNTSSITLLERLGFQQEGRLRQVGYWGGVHHDLLQYALLRQDRAPGAAHSAA